MDIQHLITRLNELLEHHSNLCIHFCRTDDLNAAEFHTGCYQAYNHILDYIHHEKKEIK